MTPSERGAPYGYLAVCAGAFVEGKIVLVSAGFAAAPDLQQHLRRR